jgi:hypothetical protein
MQGGQEPNQPSGDIQRGFLSALQDVVVVLVFALDLRRQAVEALSTTVRARDAQVAQCPRDAPVSVDIRPKWNNPREWVLKRSTSHQSALARAAYGGPVY